MNKRKLEKKERNRKDKEWKEKIKSLYGNKCAIPGCLNIKRLNAHHIIPIEIKKFRHDEKNGILLCPGHHKFFINSAHKDPLGFFIILEKFYSAQLNYLRGAREIWKS